MAGDWAKEKAAAALFERAAKLLDELRAETVNGDDEELFEDLGNGARQWAGVLHRHADRQRKAEGEGG